ncbi:MAG TPA: hypothetical protein PLU79_10820 [Burkholderiaceae bacterium]|nr:hypothetical protein [Burkholderiaceae bacterium]
MAVDANQACLKWQSRPSVDRWARQPFGQLFDWRRPSACQGVISAETPVLVWAGTRLDIRQATLSHWLTQ